MQTSWAIMWPQLRKPPSFGLAIGGPTGRLRQFGVRVPKLLLPSSVLSRVAVMTAIEGGVIDGRAFYRFQAQPQQLQKSPMLKAVWIDKDTFQFAAVA